MDGIVHECAELLQNQDQEFEEDSDICDEEFPTINPKGSRKWLIRDASTKLPKEPPCSTMKETFPWPPDLDIRTRVGKRRQEVERRYFDEIAKQLSEQQTEPPPTEKYCTTYDMTYYVEGFKPMERHYGDAPELYEKYPLYSSNPMSYWQFLYENRNGSGHAPLPDVKQPFKRRSIISKPLNEVLDDPRY